jgi:hypothetical protein
VKASEREVEKKVHLPQRPHQWNVSESDLSNMGGLFRFNASGSGARALDRGAKV